VNVDDRGTDYQDYVASLGRTVCPCCGYATNYDRFLTCRLCDWAEPLAENPSWGVTASERDQLVAEARSRYLATGSALTLGDRATWAGELSSEQRALRKELQNRLEYLKDPERPDASETWAEVDALLTQLDEETAWQDNAMPPSAPELDVVRPDEMPVRSLEPPDELPPPAVTRPRELSGVTRAANYMALIVSLVLVANFVERRYGLKSPFSMFGELGVVFLVASSGRPWWLYATVRRIGWFKAVGSDRSMQGILAVLGAFLVILAVVGQMKTG